MPGILNLSGIDLPIASVLDEHLEEVALILERQLATDLSAVNALCRHVEHYRGKRLRPILVLLSGLTTGGPPWDAAGLTERHRVVASPCARRWGTRRSIPASAPLQTRSVKASCFSYITETTSTSTRRPISRSSAARRRR
jgi:geranylgeranyl pyrophosphate synthase